MDQEEEAWKLAFATAFGIPADEFISATNRERRDSFATLTGRLVGSGAVADAPLSIAAYTHLPISRYYHFAR